MAGTLRREQSAIIMGKARKTRKFAQMKRVISITDARRQANRPAITPSKPKEEPVEEVSSSSISSSATLHWGRPTRPNFSIQKLDIFKASMDCLLGKAIPCISECVIAEVREEIPLATAHRQGPPLHANARTKAHMQMTVQ